MAYNNILIEKNDKISTIIINRPKQLNALNTETINELSLALQEAEKDQTTKAIILTGSGEKAFVAGADIKEFATFTVEEGKKLSREGHEKLFDLFNKNMKNISLEEFNREYNKMVFYTNSGNFILNI